jgi:hypothetical protein
MPGIDGACSATYLLVDFLYAVSSDARRGRHFLPTVSDVGVGLNGLLDRRVETCARCDVSRDCQTLVGWS